MIDVAIPLIIYKSLNLKDHYSAIVRKGSFLAILFFGLSLAGITNQLFRSYLYNLPIQDNEVKMYLLGGFGLFLAISFVTFFLYKLVDSSPVKQKNTTSNLDHGIEKTKWLKESEKTYITSASIQNKIERYDSIVAIIAIICTIGFIYSFLHKVSSNVVNYQNKNLNYEYHREIKECQLCSDGECVIDKSLSSFTANFNSKEVHLFTYKYNEYDDIEFGNLSSEVSCEVVEKDKFLCKKKFKTPKVFSNVEIFYMHPTLTYKVQNINNDTLNVINGLFVCTVE